MIKNPEIHNYSSQHYKRCPDGELFHVTCAQLGCFWMLPKMASFWEMRWFGQLLCRLWLLLLAVDRAYCDAPFARAAAPPAAPQDRRSNAENAAPPKQGTFTVFNYNECNVDIMKYCSKSGAKDETALLMCLQDAGAREDVLTESCQQFALLRISTFRRDDRSTSHIGVLSDLPLSCPPVAVHYFSALNHDPIRRSVLNLFGLTASWRLESTKFLSKTHRFEMSE
ncbi:unnamed protein product [Soboliphyme baturini]|uniref:Uncharacterized protein n=1 Tax=Soboliphyme baturini TaxID=241478 RepID=A0A183JA11_9BILA|nr:unnamed protein product [Soboliphyme baturini]